MIWRRKQQPRRASYEDVRLVAEVLARINADLIQSHFSLPADVASEFMSLLIAHGLFGQARPDGWHYPRVRRRSNTRHSTAEKASGKSARATSNQSAAPTEEDEQVLELRQEVSALQARIKRLQDAGRTVIQHREQWKSRALAAEQQSLELADRLARQPLDDRFDKLRRSIAKQLHPDFAQSGLEKAVRTEVFKALWAEVERIAERGP